MNSDTQGHDLMPGSDRCAARWLLLAGLVLLGALTWVVLNGYSIKAFSDPYNYLKYAHNLAGEIMTSRWPFVYPAFLWAMLKLVGPFYVFLSNLPLLLIMLALMGYITWRVARETEEPFAAALISLTAVSLIVGFSPNAILQLVNPYRDPLSHVFLLTSIVLFIRFLQMDAGKLWMLAASGLLLGLAFSVREAAILMLAPMGSLGLCIWFTGRRFNLFKVVALFVVFLAIGSSPLLIQTYLATNQVLLPPQAVLQGQALPGFHHHAALDTSHRAYYYYLESIGPGLYLALGFGLAYSLYRRNKYLIFFILPSAIVYAVFYSFYRAFIERYFLIVTIWAAPLAAYGVYQLASTLLRLGGCRRHRATVLTLLALMLSGWAVYRMFAMQIPEPRFRVKDARLLTHDINALVPEGALIICPRNFCEVLSYFTHADSYQATGLINNGPWPDVGVADYLEPMLKKGRPVYFMKMTSEEDQNADEILLRRFFDLKPITTLSRERYHLDKITGKGEMTLCHVKEWTNHRARFELGPWQPGSILQFNAGNLWDRNDGRTTARLMLNGNVVDEKLGNGSHYYALPALAVSSNSVLEIDSDAPVSSGIEPNVLKPEDSIEMDFGVFSKYSHDEYLSPTILVQRVRNPLTRTIQGDGSIRVPMLWPTQDVVTAELYARVSRYAGSGPLPLAMAADDDSPMWHSVEEDVVFQPFAVWIRRASSAVAEVRLSTVTNSSNSASHPDEWIEMDRLLIHHLPPQSNFSVDIGSGTDNPYLLSGFFKCELHDNQSSVRWTGGRAQMIMNMSPSSSGLSIGITHWTGMRPPSAPAEDIRLSFNGHPLTLTRTEGPATGKEEVITAMVPAAQVKAGANFLDIECAGWRPLDSGLSADNRLLGILLDRVDVSASNSQEPVR